MTSSPTETSTLPNLTRTFIGYELVAIIFCTLSALAVIIPLAQRTRSCDIATFTKNLPMVLTILFAWLYASVPLSMAIMYFGVPRILTLGYQVGGILPTDCATSMTIEGPDGLPCSLKRFSNWLSKATNGSGLHLDEFEMQWCDKMLQWAFAIVIIIGFYFFMKFIGRLADKEIAEKEELERMRRREAEEQSLGRKED